MLLFNLCRDNLRQILELVSATDVIRLASTCPLMKELISETDIVVRLDLYSQKVYRTWPQLFSRLKYLKSFSGLKKPASSSKHENLTSDIFGALSSTLESIKLFGGDVKESFFDSKTGLALNLAERFPKLQKLVIRSQNKSPTAFAHLQSLPKTLTSLLVEPNLYITYRDLARIDDAYNNLDAFNAQWLPASLTELKIAEKITFTKPASLAHMTALQTLHLPICRPDVILPPTITNAFVHTLTVEQARSMANVTMLSLHQLDPLFKNQYAFIDLGDQDSTEIEAKVNYTAAALEDLEISKKIRPWGLLKSLVHLHMITAPLTAPIISVLPETLTTLHAPTVNELELTSALRVFPRTLTKVAISYSTSGLDAYADLYPHKTLPNLKEWTSAGSMPASFFRAIATTNLQVFSPGITFTTTTLPSDVLVSRFAYKSVPIAPSQQVSETNISKSGSQEIPKHRKQYNIDSLSLTFNSSSHGLKIDFPESLSKLTVLHQYRPTMIEEGESFLDLHGENLPRDTLKSLDLKDDQIPRDSTFASLPPQLETLTVRFGQAFFLTARGAITGPLTSDGLAQLQNLKNLTSLDVTLAYMLPDADFIYRLPSMLKTLRFRGVDTVLDEHIAALPRSLTCLVLPDAILLSNECFKCMPPHIETVSFYRNRQMTPEVFELLPIYNCFLKDLALNRNQNFPRRLKKEKNQLSRFVSRKAWWENR